MTSMKNIIFKLTFAAFILTSGGIIYSSCKKSHLDLLPHGPTEQSYFTKEEDFNKAILGVYSKLSDFFWWNLGPQNSGMNVWLLPGDDITTNQSGEEFEIFGPLQASTGRTDYLYKRHYQLINRAILVLQKIDEVKDGIYKTGALKNSHKGEALFLRGYAYYNLWNLFGTSPLDTVRITTSSQFTPPGTTGTQLLDQAIKDFSAAADLLPSSWDAANREG